MAAADKDGTSKDAQSKLSAESDTFEQLPVKNDEAVKGGLSVAPPSLGGSIGPINPNPIGPGMIKKPIGGGMATRTTLNPTGSDGCCGGD